ncbi:MAG: beta-propeller fold lactonase family protein [Aquisalinus sp.]|nr:beta-propeller fold lactonase family protein [Aquisalinus sp.]
MSLIRWSLLAAVVLGAGSCAAFGDFTNDDPGLSEAPGTFQGRFLAVSDTDMTATAYADGQLEPVAGNRDTMSLLVDGGVKTSIAASNSVISWPQVVDVSSDGQLAFVVETKGPAAPGVSAYDSVYTDFPTGRQLSIFSVNSNSLELRQEMTGTGENLQSVEYSEKCNCLFVASETTDAELVVIPLTQDGKTGEIRKFTLEPPYAYDDTERRVRTMHISPDGDLLAVNVANRRIQFYEIFSDETGLPDRVAAIGAPVEGLGRRLAVGKWTPDGKHFIITDVNWSDNTLFMLTQGPGQLSAIRPPSAGKEAKIVSQVKVGRSPEGFGISADGTRIATINMERTYLPGLSFLSVWQGRRAYSVSLLSLDTQSGALSELDRIYQAGILPEDVIFDKTGQNLAVAVFHRRKGADRERGFIDFFSIQEDRLRSQGVTQAVPRGAHDLVSLP